jgi:hypothetical protein
MDPETFKGFSERVNRKWLARKLRMHTDNRGGIDIVNDQFGIELKTCRNNEKWSVHSDKYDLYKEQNPNRELYWAFMRYDMSLPVAKFNGKRLSQYIRCREIWFMPWDWILCRPKHTPITGPYRYVYKSSVYGNTAKNGEDSARIASTFMVENQGRALYHVPTASNLEMHIHSLHAPTPF